MAGNRIEWLAGIINGTSNYILTGMRERGRPFAEMLKEAQQLSYAEADPTFDIEGIDAAHKLTILAAIAFGIPLQFSKVYTEGIANLTPEDFRHAAELGYRIKHLGIAKRAAEGIELRVHPALIPEKRLIANVDGVMNAVLVRGDAVGPTLHYGAGAGAEPTASAVVADLVDVVRALTTDPKNRVPHLAFQAGELADLPILPVEKIVSAYYLSMDALDKPGVLADVTRILADLEISIEAILQREPPVKDKATIIILTQRTVEERINRAIAQIEKLPAMVGRVRRIRVEHLNG
jgi:homoserine dehydrogenase